MNSPQPVKPTRSYSDSAKLNKAVLSLFKKSSGFDSPKPNKTVVSVFKKSSYSDSPKLNKMVPSVFKRKRPHPRRSGILRTRSAELVNEIKSRARAVKFNKKIVEKIFGKVAPTSQEIQASVRRKTRVQKLAAERGRALNDTRELHRTIRLVMKVAVQDYHERRAATILQAIARGYLIRKQPQKKGKVARFLPNQVCSSPFTPVRTRRRNYHRQCSEITMSDFGGSARFILSDFGGSARSLSARSLASGSHSADPISVMTTPSTCTSSFEVWTEEDPTLDDVGSILGLSEVDEDESIMSQTFLQDPPSTDEPSWNPVRQTKIPKGDENRLSNCFNDSTQDIPALPPSRSRSLVKRIPCREERPAHPKSLPTINLLEDDDDDIEEESLPSIDFLEDDDIEEVPCDIKQDEDEESLCSIPPLMKVKKREGNYSSSFASSFSSVFGASQDTSDFPLARPSRSLSPLVSSPTVGNYIGSESMSSLLSVESSVGSCSFLKLSASMAEF